MKKICFAASSGGHIEEIIRLFPLTENRDCFLFTERARFESSVIGKKVYKVVQVNRKEFLFVFKLIGITMKSLYIMLKERPDVVISTGALATVPICLIARLMGKKLIYIESFARIESPSLSGKFLYKYADLFLVQWEEMLKYYPKAKYVGGIF